jgi:hypothetical protein
VDGSCPQCHAAVVPGMPVCQFCGARVEYIEAASAGESQRAELTIEEASPAPPAPAAPPSQVAPVSGVSSSGLKKLIPAAVILLAGIFILYVVLRFFTVFPNLGSGGGSAAGDTAQPANAASPSGAVSAAELGVEIYPGASAISSGDRVASQDNSVVSATFVSSDSMDRVIDFYKSRMVGQASIYASGEGVVCSFSPNAKESVLVTISPSHNGGRTQIFISHTTAKS